MTTTLAATTAAPTLPAPKLDEIPCWKTVALLISDIAIRLIPAAVVSTILFFTLPIAVSVILMPIAAVTCLVATFLLFPRSEVEGAAGPLPASAPPGIRNAGNNCWMNSLAQILMCDKAMSDWFYSIPAGFDTHGKWTEYMTQEVFENLAAGAGDIPAEVIDAVPADKQDNFRAYIAFVRGRNPEDKANIIRHVRYAREFTIFRDPGGRRPAWTPALSFKCMHAFREFVHNYRDKDVNARQVGFESQDLRAALHEITEGIRGEARYQEDASQGFDAMIQLLPPELTIRVENKKIYDATGRPPLERAGVRGANEIWHPTLVLSGSNPNMKDMLDKYCNDVKRNPEENKIRDNGHEYPLLKEETRVVTAPPSLWLPIKRFDRVSSSWVGLNRLFGGDWFPALYPDNHTGDTVKMETDVELTEFLELQPIEGPKARYRLDGFLIHIGSTPDSGHYIAYKRGVDDQGNECWFKMNDSVATRVTDAQMHKASKQTYIPHYSKIEG